MVKQKTTLIAADHKRGDFLNAGTVLSMVQAQHGLTEHAELRSAPFYLATSAARTRVVEDFFVGEFGNDVFEARFVH